MSVRFFFVLLLWPFAASAQGFGGLGTEAEGFATPKRGYEFAFPQDHGSHPDFRVEWWYLTANMIGDDGREYGLQWTLFRSALAPGTQDGWSDPQVWMAHAAVTTPDRHFVTERLARGGIGQAGVVAAPFAAWIDEWQLTGDVSNMSAKAAGADFAFDVSLDAQGPLIFHGDDGYSVKSPDGQASYYYSQPFFDLNGVLTFPRGDVAVTGQAWLDREWSTQPLSNDQTGWDWFSLSFESGDKLMGFRLRQIDGGFFTAATWIASDGTTTAYPDGAFSASPMNLHQSPGAKLPTQWRVTLPDRGVDAVVTALNPNAWMATSIPYWEGPIAISGSHLGRGYLEMTGYE